MCRKFKETGMNEDPQNKPLSKSEADTPKPVNKRVTGVIGALFAAVAGTFAIAELPYRVPSLIENNHDGAVRAIIKYLPHPASGRPTEVSLETALVKNKFALAGFIADRVPPYDLAEAARALDMANARRAGAKETEGLRLLFGKGLARDDRFMKEEAVRAAALGELERLKTFIEFGAPVNGPLLANAASAPSTDTLKYLLSHYTFSDADKQEALVYSLSFYGNADAFGLLLAQVEPDRETQDKMLDEAVRQDNVKVVQYLLKTYRFDPETKAKALKSALERSARPLTAGYLMDRSDIPQAVKIEAIRETLGHESPATLQLADRLVELQGGPKTPVRPLTLAPPAQ
jgi:hypothetical protein